MQQTRAPADAVQESRMEPPKVAYDVPPEMREFAEKSVEQARKAVGAARKTADTLESSATSVQASSKEATRKTFSYAEQSIGAAFELAQKLVRAKDMQEAMQIQAEFARTQFAALQAQMKEFGSLAQSTMNQAGGTKPKA
jgi:phasin